jgi:ATP-binding cassette subfamily B protein
VTQQHGPPKVTGVSEFARIRHLLLEAVWVYLRPYWKVHALIAAGVVVLVLFEAALPLTIRFLIDEALLPHDPRKLILAVGLLVLLFGAAAVSRFVLAVVRAHVARELYWDLSTGIFRSLQRLPLAYFDRVEPAHFAPLFDTELLTFSAMARDLFERGLQYLLQLAVIVVTMLVLSWPLGLLVMLTLPLIAWQPQRRLGLTLAATDRIRNVVERVNGIVQDQVSTQVLVRAFGRGEETSRRFEQDVAGRTGAPNTLASIADLRRTLRIPHYLLQTFKLSMDNMQAGVTLLVIGAGAGLSFAGWLSLGTYSAFILFLPVAMRAIGNLAAYVQDLGRATLSLDRIEAVRSAELPARDAHASTLLTRPIQGIRFEQIHFSYTENSPYIRDVNLDLPAGRSVAFVGRSGAGKSTLFKLLLGFYEPSAGRVAIDGLDIRQIDPASLGSHIGTVLQQPLLVNTTVRRNIAYAKPDASDEEVTAAARLAGIHDFIVSLPKAYESPVGEGGKFFSEGQRQRLSLARAILPDPAVLLLDEVTSSLDPETESAINGTIRQLARARTVMLVTHRLASVAFVDHIVVMEQGQVVEQGRHEELLARGSLYCQLWQMQAGFVVSGDGHHAEVSGERLRAIPLFREVDVNALQALAGRFVSRFYEPGQVVYEQGDPGDKFYIVVRGTVSISTLDAGHQVIRLADLQDGDYFGEVEMVNTGRRTTTVKAHSPSLVLALDAEHFHGMVEGLSALSKVVTQMALGRSLSTICSVGRRRRSHPVWQELSGRQ